MLESIITKKIMEFIRRTLKETKGKKTYINLFNSGIIINLSTIRVLIADRGEKYIEKKVEKFIKSNF